MTLSERVTLNDDEFYCFASCDDIDLELRIMGAMARTIGGLRTGDLKNVGLGRHRHGELRAVRRSKSKDEAQAAPQNLSVPETVRPPI